MNHHTFMKDTHGINPCQIYIVAIDNKRSIEPMYLGEENRNFN